MVSRRLIAAVIVAVLCISVTPPATAGPLAAAEAPRAGEMPALWQRLALTFLEWLGLTPDGAPPAPGGQSDLGPGMDPNG